MPTPNKLKFIFNDVNLLSYKNYCINLNQINNNLQILLLIKILINSFPMISMKNQNTKEVRSDF